MLDEKTTSTLDMYVLCGISEQQVCEMLGRKEFVLTEEESTYVGCLQKDYDQYLITKQMLQNESSN